MGTNNQYEFPFLSIEVEESEFVRLGEGVHRVREPLYKEDAATWQPSGDRVGWVFIKEERATREGDLVELSATVRTDDGHKVDVKLIVEKGPDGKYGKGKGGMTGGTGKWKGRADVIDLEHHNPKRWRIGEGG